jgi:hypothetical protein
MIYNQQEAIEFYKHSNEVLQCLLAIVRQLS